MTECTDTKKLTKCGKTRPLNIVGFDDRSQRHPEGIHLPDYMPKHEFFMLIVAPAGCGKTTLILNLLLRIYRQYFNDIIVFSPTIHNDQKWKHLTEQSDVLRPNPHCHLWEGKVKLKNVNASTECGKGDDNKMESGFNEWTPEIQQMLNTTPDTFLFETFKKPKGKNKNRAVVKEKKMGKAYLEQWKRWQNMHQSQEHRFGAPQSTQRLLQEKKRIHGISMVIAPPTPPKLAHEMRQFQQLLGLQPNIGLVLPDDSSDFIIQDVGANDAAHGSNLIRPRFHVNYTPLAHGTQHHIGGVCGGGASGALFAGGSRALTTTPSIHSERLRRRRTTVYPFSNIPRGARNDKTTPYHEGQYEEAGHRQHIDDEQDINPGSNTDAVASRHGTLKKHKKTRVNPERLFEEYDEETLDTLMKNQDKIVNHLTNMGKEMTDADHLCFVFDDMVGSGLFNQKRNNAFKRLTVRRRHFCSSVIGVVQAYKEFPKTSRNNTNIYILFRIESDEELSAIYKDFPCGLKPHVWLSVYKYCTREPYHFMMINLQTSNPDHRIIKNFDEPIPLPAYEEDQDMWLRRQSFHHDSEIHHHHHDHHHDHHGKKKSESEPVQG